jgi:hypothetical protein
VERNRIFRTPSPTNNQFSSLDPNSFIFAGYADGWLFFFKNRPKKLNIQITHRIVKLKPAEVILLGTCGSKKSSFSLNMLDEICCWVLNNILKKFEAEKTKMGAKVREVVSITPIMVRMPGRGDLSVGGGPAWHY